MAKIGDRLQQIQVILGVAFETCKGLGFFLRVKKHSVDRMSYGLICFENLFWGQTNRRNYL